MILLKTLTHRHLVIGKRQLFGRGTGDVREHNTQPSSQLVVWLFETNSSSLLLFKYH